MPLEISHNGRDGFTMESKLAVYLISANERKKEMYLMVYDAGLLFSDYRNLSALRSGGLSGKIISYAVDYRSSDIPDNDMSGRLPKRGS